MVSSVSSVKGLAHVVDWSIQTKSAGITVMNDDTVSQMEDFSFLDLSIDRDEWELPMLPTDLDDSFDIVASPAPMSGHQGPSQPLPKMKNHTRVVRPRVELNLVLQNGIPTRNNVVSSSMLRQHGQLNVLGLQQMSELTPFSPSVPKSVTWMSVDDLHPQPLPPGGRGIPISLRSGASKTPLEVAPGMTTLPETTNDEGGGRSIILQSTSATSHGQSTKFCYSVGSYQTTE